MTRSPETTFSKLSDGELLHVLASEGRESPRVQAAWNEFYTRHVDYLYRVCMRAHRARIGEGKVGDVVHDTFIRAYERAATYEEPEAAEDGLRHRQIRAWLGQIANNIVMDLFRREPQISFVDDKELQEVQVREEEPNESCGRLKLLEEALDNLSDREQDVLRATAQWYVPGQKQQRMPNSEMKRLAADLQTSAANIRQIRLRAIRKLEDAIDRIEGHNSGEN
jgi:RNA polymerase sigma factor (sigma-70 family)